ncbi:MAG: hypothetical protein Q7S87_03330 [Agitococcus sp.]|nr:hypothetical protein [Agitococcus sp.]MDO9178668.1 hypothetical protein [Agitococcus sp.]
MLNKQKKTTALAIGQVLVAGAGLRNAMMSQALFTLHKSEMPGTNVALGVIEKPNAQPWYQRESQRGGKKFAKQSTRLKG